MNLPKLLGGALGAVALSTLASSPLLGQIPDGAHVMSRLKVPTVWSGDSGVFVAHPRDPQALTPLTGVPESISYASDNNPGAFGANCVLHDPRNGGVVVGTNGRAGETLDLHRLTLNGLHVVTVERYTLGLLVANGGGVFEMDWIDDHQVVCAIGAIGGPAGTPATVQLCRVNLDTGVVDEVQLPNYTGGGYVNAVAYDRASGDVYFGVGGLPSGSAVYRMRLAAPTTPALVTTLPASAIRSMAVDHDGNVVAGLGVAPGGATPALVRIDSAGAVTPLLVGFDNVNAFAIEPTTGQFAIAGQDDRTDPTRYGHYFFDGATVDTLGLTRTNGGPAGALSGVAVAPSPVAFGAPSGAGIFTWSTAPDPHGLPIAGDNLHAALDWPAGVVPGLGFALLSNGTGSTPIQGVELLLDSAGLQAVVTPLIRDFGARQSRIHMPLSPATKGTTCYLQAFHATYGGFAASAGLRIAVQ